MTHSIDAVWATTSPYLKRFDQPLLDQLSKHLTIAQWQYQQSEDEPSSLSTAVDLLHDYIQDCDHPIHLVGHGTGGLVSLLYARQCPQNIRSLTLLGVGAVATLDWMAHYYFHLQFVPYNRRQMLTQIVPDLFGDQQPTVTCYLSRLLEKDMMVSPSPHSLFQRCHLPPGGVSAPLLVCGSQNDPVVDSQALNEWQSWMKDCDRIWQCAEGHHFFHCFYPQLVAEQILDFWQVKPAMPLASIDLRPCSV
ncbi:alpha/beta hydrolase [Acaryochloris sp. IP29b_bin.148]|uniref:alpha/beta fold hydrolase n=1 Tax=Acaryochloris sp. IP29b_bin.148 TaxID=2969218 RepID=UPI00262746BA|nr:alpha/beta hydrolase [Acaryochloris sp. IP29b_bin.148]